MISSHPHGNPSAQLADSVLEDAQRFRHAMEIDTVGIVLFSLDGPILRANNAFLRMTGYTHQDIQSGRLHRSDLTPPEWKHASAYAAEQFHTHGSITPYEKEYLRKDGSRFWIFIASKRLSEAEGIAFVLDITQRKVAEAMLRDAQSQLERSETQLQTITDALPTLIAYVDPDLRYLRVNRVYASYFDTTPDEMIGQYMRDVLGAAYPEVASHIRRALAGEPQTFEITIQAAFGARQMLANHVPDIGPDDIVRGVVIQSHDMTDRKQTEHLLRTAEKLAAVGRLAASMAHEINNPLESVTNLLYLARNTEDRTLVEHYLLQADHELRRVSAITNQTLRFHKQSTKPVPLRPGDLFESVLTVYSGRLANAHVQLETRVSAPEPIICFDGEIRQILSNLVSNALDAMAGREGRLLLRACRSTHWRTGRPGLRLTVADTGTGMDAETLTRMWEPFFTTKEIGGTGLGIWISRDIAERHAGTLTARSRPGAGTVFALWLPFQAVTR